MRKKVFDETMDGIRIDRIIRDYEFTMSSKHVHDDYEIYYLLEGDRYYFIENKTYLISEGSLVFINKGQIHKTGNASKSHHDRILIVLREEPFATFLSSVCDISLSDFFKNNNGVIKLNDAAQDCVKSYLLGIADEIHQKKPHYEASVMMNLCFLFILAIRCSTCESSLDIPNLSNTAIHKKVDEVASYITSNYVEAKSLDELSKHFSINKCYLSRIFKEVTGFTVSEYININRIKEAKNLLLTTNLSMSEISHNIGYESITYFEKVFFKFTETSPLKYRKQHQKAEHSAHNKKKVSKRNC